MDDETPEAALAALCADLAAEHEALDQVVAPLSDAQWATPTPAEGWDVRDTIAHLAYFDEKAVLAATDPDAFATHLDAVLTDLEGFMAEPETRGRAMAPGDVLAWWRGARARTVEIFAAMDPKARLPWYGPPMSTLSFATARLMETWAHGADVVDGLDEAGVAVSRPATDRLRHICHLGVRTRAFTYSHHERELPAGEVRVELTAPSGATWTWGPHDAADRVVGTAEDFCLVATQRRHVDDTGLVCSGPHAHEWLLIAQAFAGPPTFGPPAGRFA